MSWAFISSVFQRSGYTIQFFIASFIIFCSSLSIAQVTIDPNSGPQTMTMNLPGDSILFLQVTVYDADYSDEGLLYVNDQGPIQLWPGVDSSGNDMAQTINLSLNNTQKSWFTSGDNTLRFEFKTDSANGEGYRVDKVVPVSSIETKKYSDFDINVDAPISANRKLALEIYKRLVGITTPIDNPLLVEMENKLNQGDKRGAAQLATQESGFYNLVVRDFAARMSTREESINETFNDFIATFIGVIRDNLDARLLLTGNFFYKANIDTPVRSNTLSDILGSNRHYSDLENNNYDFASVLTKENAQYMASSDRSSFVTHPDAAGVITSRAFMGAHALDGTNRRLVQYTVKQFACFEMSEWADATASDIRVGRDVDRAPGGETSKFLTTCKSCHSVMDGFRGAFAKYDFDRNFVKYDFDAGPGTNSVDRKMNQNGSVFAPGYVTTDNTWINNATSASNQQRFGWRGIASSGTGVKQFAAAIANSRAFSKCMVQRVYREVCRRPVANFEAGMIETMANTFESTGYNLKSLFEEIAIRPECIGVR